MSPQIKSYGGKESRSMLSNFVLAPMTLGHVVHEWRRLMAGLSKATVLLWQILSCHCLRLALSLFPLKTWLLLVFYFCPCRKYAKSNQS